MDDLPVVVIMPVSIFRSTFKLHLGTWSRKADVRETSSNQDQLGGGYHDIRDILSGPFGRCRGRL